MCSPLVLYCDLAPYIQCIQAPHSFQSFQKSVPTISGCFSSIGQGYLSNQLIAIKTFGVVAETTGGRGATRDVEAAGEIEAAKKIEQVIAHEYEIWHRIRHQNILPLVGMCYLDGNTFPSFVSPWQGNGYILDFLRENPSSDLMFMLQRIGEAICYLHGNDIVHNDVRAANILVSSAGSPLLSNFSTSQDGCSRQEVPISHFKGNARWMANELHISKNSRGYRPFSTASDIWSFGMTMLELFTGEIPYHELSSAWGDEGAIFNIKSGHLPQFTDALHPQWEHMGEVLQEICQLCWRLNPFERPSIENLLAIMRSVSTADLSESAESVDLGGGIGQGELNDNIQLRQSKSESKAESGLISSLLERIIIRAPTRSAHLEFSFVTPSHSPAPEKSGGTLYSHANNNLSALSLPEEPSNSAVSPTPAFPPTGTPIALDPTPIVLSYKSVLYNHLARVGSLRNLSTSFESDGPAHAPIWYATICLEDAEVGRASGGSKSAAENEASKIALEKICTRALDTDVYRAPFSKL